MESNQCVLCAHYQGVLTCAAFPEGIPPTILDGTADHREPFKGDNGIRWEPAPDAPKSLIEDLDA
jgi:hypothetical protein